MDKVNIMHGYIGQNVPSPSDMVDNSGNVTDELKNIAKTNAQ